VVSGASVGAIVLPGAVGQGWGVVGKYISRQNGYERTDTIPVVVVAEEKGKMHKTGCITLYPKTLEGSIKNRKNRKTFIYLCR